MRKIPKIPKGQQMLSTHHGLYPELQTWDYADDRMQKGANRYGYSWCEVDLKEDMLEELADIYNYVILMRLRVDALDTELTVDEEAALNYIVSLVTDIEEVLELDVPDFEGPTSAEWYDAMTTGATTTGNSYEL